MFRKEKELNNKIVALEEKIDVLEKEIDFLNKQYGALEHENRVLNNFYKETITAKEKKAPKKKTDKKGDN